MIQLSEIWIYPVKSTSGISISRSMVEPEGLCFDRRFLITDLNGHFITARECPELLLIQATPTQKGLHLNFNQTCSFQLNYSDFSQQYLTTNIWKDHVQGQHCSNEADLWLSRKIKRPCKLIFFGNQSKRTTEINPKATVSFADGYPLLLTNTASLNALNQHSTHPISMQQFRPNIVIDTSQAFAEDLWLQIRVGEVEFDIVKHCERCVMTTFNPKTAQAIENEQPLNALRKIRQDQTGAVFFGQNLIPRNSGIIQSGDKVTVLASQPAKAFISPTANSPVAYFDITLRKSKKAITTNNQQPLLSQLEAAGIKPPFGCRNGTCGQCKLKLLSGNIKENSTKPLTDKEINNGTILTCSSIALSNLTIDL